MNLPEPPSAFRPPNSTERPWSWRYEAPDGSAVDLAGTDVAEYAEERFASQADAESWIGETWQDLLDAGVAQVTLLEVDREVYGPMALSTE